MTDATVVRHRAHLRPRATKATHFQPHIQGLRAVAVILVVLYHFWPGRISGGYIGVDVFFVISGFLITGQLGREIERTGRISLPQFWAKRARRLLPAALTVLFVGVLLTVFILPLSSLPGSLREILSSAFYVENWSLAASSVDYLAAHDATLAQHYWSLSVEEQFYIVWPFLLLLAAWLGVKLFAGRRWLPIIGIVALVSVASFVLSIAYTHSNPAEAFFVTFTRAWEFGAGAVLALLSRLRPRQAWLSSVLGYGGVLVILVCAYRYDQNTQFPGTAAILPVLGAAAVIVAERRECWWEAGRVLGTAVPRFFGDISYSVYLWHWPLVVIAPYIPGFGTDGWNRVVLVLASFALGWLSKRFVEDPGRQWRWLTARRPRWTYGIVVIGGMAVVALAAGVAFGVQQPKYQAATAELASISAHPPACFGALAGPDCQNPALKGRVIPDAGFGNADEPGHVDCFVQLNESTVKACRFGSSKADAPRVALIGDSHAYQYIETMIRLADRHGWALTTYLKGACPWTTAPVGGPSQTFIDSCTQYRADLKATLAKAPRFDAIFTASLHDTPYVGATTDQVETGFEQAWSQQAKGAPIVTIVDNPDFSVDPNKCLRVSAPVACAEPRDEVLPKVDAMAAAARATQATLVDLTDTYCDEQRCFAVIGGANVYRDQDHLTVTWTLTMSDAMGGAVQKVLASSKVPLE